MCPVEKAYVVLNDQVLWFCFPFLLMGIAGGPYSIWFIYSEAHFQWSSLTNGDAVCLKYIYLQTQSFFSSSSFFVCV
jgi:hypothetical protein